MDKSCALDPLWDIQQSILYIGQTVRSLEQQMKEHNIYIWGSDIQKCCTVSSRVCHRQDALGQLGRDTGCGQPSSLQPVVHAGGQTHHVKEKQCEQSPLLYTYMFPTPVISTISHIQMCLPCIHLHSLFNNLLHLFVMIDPICTQVKDVHSTVGPCR